MARIPTENLQQLSIAFVKVAAQDFATPRVRETNTAPRTRRVFAARSARGPGGFFAGRPNSVRGRGASGAYGNGIALTTCRWSDIMTTFRQWTTKEIHALARVFGTSAALLVLAGPSLAESTAYHATFIEPYGGPSTPSACAPGTSCGTANVSTLGHGSTVVYFLGCGADCHLRVITFYDGSEILMNEYGNLADFASPGNAGSNGYIGFGLPGNPQVLQVTQKIVGGSGRFANVTGGSGAGTVRIAGGVAIITSVGTITTP